MRTAGGMKFIQVWKLIAMLGDLDPDSYATTQNMANTGGLSIFTSPITFSPVTHHIDIGAEQIDDYVHDIVKKLHDKDTKNEWVDDLMRKGS